MRQIHIYFAVIILLAACKQELCDPASVSDSSAIELLFDWSESTLDTDDIYNVSTYAYRRGSSSPYFKVTGSTERGAISLPAGDYSLLVFNDVVGDIKGVSFSGSNSLDDFAAMLTVQTESYDGYYEPADNERVAQEQGQIAAWLSESLTVTQDMVSCAYCGLIHTEQVTIDVTPQPITTQCIFTIRVENLYNAQSFECIVKGFAKGAYISTGERLSDSDYTYVYNVEFTSATYDDTSRQDGTIEGEITTFGKTPNEDQSYELELYVILDSGELLSFTRDITDQVISGDNITIEVSLTTEENMISLPEGVGTGFEVDAWGDKELIELL